MNDEVTTIKELRDMIAAFVEERQWSRFHSPKNLSMSIAIEAAELMELFQWDDPREPDVSSTERISEELADVVIYCLLMADAAEIDLAWAIKNKVSANTDKYPVEKFRGKYKA